MFNKISVIMLGSKGYKERYSRVREIIKNGGVGFFFM